MVLWGVEASTTRAFTFFRFLEPSRSDEASELILQIFTFFINISFQYMANSPGFAYAADSQW